MLAGSPKADDLHVCVVDRLKQDLEQNLKALRAEKRRLRTLEKKEEHLGLTEAAMWMAGAILELAPESPSIARAYILLAMKSREDSCDIVTACVIDDTIADFVKSNPSKFDGTDMAPSCRARRQRASRFVAEYKLKEYIKEKNEQNGVAPPSSSCLIHYVQELNKIGSPGAEDLTKKLQHRSASGSRRWMTDWRRRWGLTFGQMPPGCQMTADEISVQVLIEKRVPKNGTISVPPVEGI